MASEVKVDKLSQKGSSGIVISDDIKLSSGKAIKQADGTDLLTEAGAYGDVKLASGTAIKNAAGTALLTQAGVLDNVTLGDVMFSTVTHHATQSSMLDITGDLSFLLSNFTITGTLLVPETVSSVTHIKATRKCHIWADIMGIYNGTNYVEIYKNTTRMTEPYGVHSGAAANFSLDIDDYIKFHIDDLQDTSNICHVNICAIELG